MALNLPAIAREALASLCEMENMARATGAEAAADNAQNDNENQPSNPE